MDALTFRKADTSCLEASWRIITEAKALMKSVGSRQWNDAYPSPHVIEDDLSSGDAYMLERAGEQIAYAVVRFADEAAYSAIDGAWLTDGTPYAVVHRLAVAEAYRGQGYATAFFQRIIALASANGCRSIRVDTAAENCRMLQIFRRECFVYCGKVTYPGVDRGERLAYERLL